MEDLLIQSYSFALRTFLPFLIVCGVVALVSGLLQAAFYLNEKTLSKSFLIIAVVAIVYVGASTFWDNLSEYTFGLYSNITDIVDT